MSATIDLREFLDAWPFDPEKDARIVRVPGGREVLQVRLPLGLEQYELEGRPDGLRPHGQESLLDYHLARLAQAKEQGQEDSFELSSAECQDLFNEGTLYYFRYLRFFQLKKWSLTVRDTTRNLRLFDFVRRYAAQETDQEYLEKWRPYILRMNAIARAMIDLSQSRHDQAQAILREALREIQALPELDNDTFRYESQRSLTDLGELLLQLEQTRPLSRLERLEKQLQEAVEAQEFERAAMLRDRLRELRSRNAEDSPQNGSTD